jgi:two-component system, probable response regulator PhcQ
MSADKILYVDDEPMALKYFERLVSPLAPVITALSVEAGKAILRERAGEIAVLVTDQRMPGAHGNELLRYTREYHPRIVRMLTTAYSEIGEAIEAINSGEIYRYITKPWEMGSLHADLRNALELAELRNERDFLLREKLLVQQRQLLGSRMASLAMLSAGLVSADSSLALHRFARAALAAGCKVPEASWNQWDHATLLQAEADRGIAIARALSDWHKQFGADRAPDKAFAALAQAFGGRMESAAVRLPSPAVLTALLDAAPGDAPEVDATAWLAWLLWANVPTEVSFEVQGGLGQWVARASDAAAAPTPPQRDWLAQTIEQLVEG